MAGMTIGSLLGPLAGGFLYDVWGYGIPFAVAGGLVMLDGLFRLTLLPNDPGQPAFSNPLPTLLRDRTVLSSALVIALIAGSWAVVDPYLPAHLTTTFGVSPTFVGVLFTVAGVAYALVTNPVQRMSETRGIRNTILFGMVLMAVSLPLLVSVPSLPFAVVLLCLVSVAFAFAMNPTLAGLADVADRRAPGAYASAYAVFNLAYAVGMIGADLLTGPLVRNFSLVVGFLGMSLVLLASLPVLWWTEKIPSTKETSTS
jgi:predicted MFS family arabinose efflux permease